MYSADLMIWLWTILINGKSSYPYNVGSSSIINMEDLAILIASCFSKEIEILPSPSSNTFFLH